MSETPETMLRMLRIHGALRRQPILSILRILSATKCLGDGARRMR